MDRIGKSLLAVSLSLFCTASHAWWNEQWTQRTKVTLNTSVTGTESKAPITNLPVAIRLHSGNFDFLSVKEDGADIRVVGGDDKTPLKFHIERFDSTNELALLWVQVPRLEPSSEKNVIYVYAGNEAATPESNVAATYDATYLAVFHFGEKAGVAIDATTAALKATSPVPIDANGLLGQSANFSGTPVTIAGGERLKLAASAGYTLSVWVKPKDTTTGTLAQIGNISLALAKGQLSATVGTAKLSGGSLNVDRWHFAALSVAGGKAHLYLDGTEVAVTDAAGSVATDVATNVAGNLSVGTLYNGLLDELQIASGERSPDFLKLSNGAQTAEGKLLTFAKESQGNEASEGGSHNYFGILVSNLTTDAWVVIIILMIMLVIAVWVMIAKLLYIAKVEKANFSFLRRFRDLTESNILSLSETEDYKSSSLFVLYRAGVREINKRFAARASVGAAGNQVLSGASIDAIKASIDADLVRESHKLNSLMVLLTIAISGGPFLGLLGTVVGVMITFAAIAAAGDVNVNAIAPGIAAALLATVAGLAVAIPALFGYNWLAAKIKNISSDMQIFVDEFVTGVAERYGD